MDLGYTASQQALRGAARGLLEQECGTEQLHAIDQTATGFSPALWKKLAGLNLIGLGIPQAYGGQGGSYTDLSVVLQELGRFCAPVPFFSSAVLAAQILLVAGSEAQKRAILPAIAHGERIVAVAITEPDFGWRPAQIQLAASRQADAYVLSGTKVFVPDAQIADELIVAARTGSDPVGGITLFLVDAKAAGLRIRHLEGFVAGRLNEVTLEAVKVPPDAVVGTVGGGWRVLDEVLARCVPALCSQIVGGCERVFEMTRDHAQKRVQFGAAVGTFQRVQDHVIEIVNGMDAARWTTLEAVWKLDAQKPDWRTSSALAKVVASEAYHQATYHAHEVCAGAGSRREFGLHFHTRAARTYYWYLGEPKLYREQLADLLAL